MPKGKIIRKKTKALRIDTRINPLIPIIILSILGVIFYFILQQRNIPSPSQTSVFPTPDSLLIEDGPTVVVHSADEATLTKARGLVVEYFEGLKDPSQEENMRIEDYTLHSLYGDISDKYLLIGMTYSIKPVMKDSAWSQSSGAPGNDGWIRNSGACTRLDRIGDSFSKVEGIGTGCGKLQFSK